MLATHGIWNVLWSCILIFCIVYSLKSSWPEMHHGNDDVPQTYLLGIGQVTSQQQTTPKFHQLKAMKLYFSLMLLDLYESSRALLHIVLRWQNLYYLVCWCLLPWQQKRNLVNYILVLKVEVKHFTSAHISLAQTSYMAMPSFLCPPKEILVNITSTLGK